MVKLFMELHSFFINNLWQLVKDHHYITSAKGLGGCVLTMAIFADVQYCIYADIVGGWVKKSR